VGWIQRGVLERVRHCEAGALAVLWRQSDVVGVPAHAEADELRVDAGAAPARMLELLEDESAAAIAQYEAVALEVPRAARLGGSLVARRERLRLREARET